MKNNNFWLVPLLGILIFAVFAALAAAQSNAIAGQGQVIITVMPKHESQLPPAVQNSDLGVKVNTVKLSSSPAGTNLSLTLRGSQHQGLT